MLFREDISNVNDDAMRLESIGSLDETATGRFNPSDSSLPSSIDLDSATVARESELFSGQADVFAFERCVSRLVEMSTEAYANLSHVTDSNHNCVSANGTGFSTLPEAPPRNEEEEEEEEEDKDKDADPLVEVPREVYFADVKLQMATKQWEDHFNRRKPPKRIHFLHCHAIELVPAGAGPDWRSGSGEVLAVERFIEGEYIKHKVSSAQFRRPLRHLLDRAID